MISGLILTQDNQRTIGAVLDQLTAVADEVADEVIVVDGGSSDKTPDIAATYPKVRLFTRPFGDNFAAQRNFALSKARGSWILSMDSDELFSQSAAGFIRRWTQNPLFTHYRFPRYWLVERDGAFYYCVSKQHYPDYQTRLFRNRSSFRYVDDKPIVHEDFKRANKYFGRKVSEVHLFHFCLLQTVERRREKIARYVRIEGRDAPINGAYIWERDDVELRPIPEPLPGRLNV